MIQQNNDIFGPLITSIGACKKKSSSCKYLMFWPSDVFWGNGPGHRETTLSKHPFIPLSYRTCCWPEKIRVRMTPWWFWCTSKLTLTAGMSNSNLVGVSISFESSSSSFACDGQRDMRLRYVSVCSSKTKKIPKGTADVHVENSQPG